MEWPEWWDWELELIVHAEERLEDREVSDVELRSMLDRAFLLEPDHVPGRWVVHTRHAGATWFVVLEPDPTSRVTFVITMYQRN